MYFLSALGLNTNLFYPVLFWQNSYEQKYFLSASVLSEKDIFYPVLF